MLRLDDARLGVDKASYASAIIGDDSPYSPGYLRNFAEEARQVGPASEAAQYRGLCRLEVHYNVTPDEIFDVFAWHHGRVVVFHYGGHADSFRLLLSDAAGNTRLAYASGLAHFLGQGVETGTQLESISNEAPPQTDEPCYNRRRP